MTERPDRVDQLIATWRSELPTALTQTSELSKRVMVLAADLDAASRRVFDELGLTATEFDVLAALRRSGKPYRLRSNELSKSLLLSTGGTSNVINRLVARRLAERDADPGDGRSTRISLTPDGVALAEKALIANSRAHESVFAPVPARYVQAATGALRDVFTATDTRP
ncbi:DNA-binding MarR family transcriptional regulator [Herbihabitans rhizosphaerae]|uniref:DNA-binding MarR family transcriptional regulator n=1 Tax=Herbihabitans rhizosphaerae TaxID=1872711 RepID=A0A4Q7L7B6_9PSEU|nr:MarR family transcriptional regulator [Herbihabitans rhizosphaerae]RZS45164.1 DNA-binding MarR family transcriptional regulator [Herbihabitans rhizosphaerae]